MRLARHLALAIAAATVAAALAPPALARIHMGADYGEPPPPKPAPPVDPATTFDWGVGARAGYFGGPVFGEGLEAFRRTGDWNLGLAAYYGAADLTAALTDRAASVPALAGFTVESAKVRSTLVQLEGRRSVLGIVDARLGLGYRTIAGRLTLAADDGSGRWRADASAASVVVAASVCRYWTWSNGVYAGLDMIGADLPLASSHHVSTSSDPTVAESSRASLDHEVSKLAGQYASAPGLVLLLGALGYRF